MTIVTVPCLLWLAISASMATRNGCPAVIFPVLLERPSANNSDIAADEGFLVRSLTQSLVRVCYGFGGARKLMFSYSIMNAVLEATTFRLLTVVKERRGVVP